ncbi:MAG: hypothetical protein ACRDSF_19060, partial [Pseudonocardiaceae bacterium]
NIFGLTTRYTARAWLPQVERAAEEVARELVSRAVKTTGIPGPRPPWTAFHDEEIPLIETRLRLEYPSLFVEVWDGDRTSPYPLPGAHLDDHMDAVQKHAQRWDWYPLGRGKLIWAELGMPHKGGLPRRTTGRFSYPAPNGQGEPLRDVEAMRRVRDGLARLDSDGPRGVAR